MVHRSHPFRYHSQDRQPIEREIDVFICDVCTLTWRQNFEIAVKNGGTTLDLKDWIDIEISVSTLDALSIIAIILYPIDKCTSVRYR